MLVGADFYSPHSEFQSILKNTQGTRAMADPRQGTTGNDGTIETRNANTAKPASKKPYRKPQLDGNLRALTAAKGGFSFDGGGKPSTRSSGGQS